jgi:hypothetical protein
MPSSAFIGVAEFLQYVATPGNEKIIIIKRKTVKHVYTENYIQVIPHHKYFF